MKLLPWQRFEIETPADINSVLQRLRDETQPASFLPGAGTNRDSPTAFRGRIDKTGFRISVRGPIAFSPMPEIHGVISETENGSRVRVELVPATWLLVTLAGVFALLSILLFDTGYQVFAMTAAMLPFGWFLTTAGFLLDGGDSQRKLETVLSGEPAHDYAGSALRGSSPES